LRETFADALMHTATIAQPLRMDGVTSSALNLCSQVPRLISICVRAEHLSEGSDLIRFRRAVTVGFLSIGLLRAST
jgi:hypothetical protein